MGVAKLVVRDYIYLDTKKYNECALYVTMCMIISDSGNTLTALVSDLKKLFELVYHLALDKLNDKDGKFNIRKYFLE